jgi:LSD1 subclass zinc finger protein
MLGMWAGLWLKSTRTTIEKLKGLRHQWRGAHVCRPALCAAINLIVKRIDLVLHATAVA